MGSVALKEASFRSISNSPNAMANSYSGKNLVLHYFYVKISTIVWHLLLGSEDEKYRQLIVFKN